MSDEASSQERVTPRLARWARYVLLLGIAVAVVPLFSHFPREQVLVFRAHNAWIDHLDAAWTPDGESDASGGVALNLPEPTPEVTHRVSLPNGRYTLAIHYNRTQAEVRAPNRGARAPDGVEPVEATVTRRVNLSGGETVIGL